MASTVRNGTISEFATKSGQRIKYARHYKCLTDEDGYIMGALYHRRWLAIWFHQDNAVTMLGDAMRQFDYDLHAYYLGVDL